jgi:hypothetical protein
MTPSEPQGIRRTMFTVTKYAFSCFRTCQPLHENEGFFLEAARSSGLRVVDAQLVHDCEGTAGLQVVRFDRGADSGLAAEDA